MILKTDIIWGNYGRGFCVFYRGERKAQGFIYWKELNVAWSQKVFSLRMRPKWKYVPFEIKQTFKWCPKTLLFCLSLFRRVHLPVSRFCNKWTTHCTKMAFNNFTSGWFPITVHCAVVFRWNVNLSKILNFFNSSSRGIFA